MAKEKPYYEPDNYFPEELRKKYKLGEYNEEAQKEAEEVEKELRNKELRSVFKGK